MTTPNTTGAPAPAQPGKALTVQQQRRVTLRNLFEQQRPELAKLLPRGMDPDRLFRMALTECIKQPKLLECTAESWALAVQTCAQQGLYPDSGLGYMYLVPRNMKRKLPDGTWTQRMEVSAMRGYQGDIRLARNSGEIADIYAEVVYAKDNYKVKKGLNRDIVHEPFDGEEDPGPLRACYAVAKLTTGEVAFVTLTKRDVLRHKASSESADSDYSPWKNHEAAMWRKTAIHELAKWLPKATEKAEAVARELVGERPIDTTAIAVSSVPLEPVSGLEGLTARLEAEAPPPGCQHPAVPPSKVAELKPGNKLVCPDCGEEFAAPEREPGSDDGPPAAAKAKPRQGRLQE